ncbi:hypothetical protein PI125_g15064 [Phytophthora idaei]|nr:hypothetical protein PI125_g15064 [Phytophthora idaei]
MEIGNAAVSEDRFSENFDLTATEQADGTPNESPGASFASTSLACASLGDRALDWKVRS